jgi:probable rRNA maturation factor
LSLEGVRKPGVVTICFINRQQIKEINLQYLAKYEPTDVIAFDLSDKKDEIFADIAVSTDAAYANASSYKTSAAYEACLYVVHGMLHILGYKDSTARQKILMQQKAEDILGSL